MATQDLTSSDLRTAFSIKKKDGDGDRTQNLLIICLTLYQLSHLGLIYYNF
jgi:hypothetical protein